MEFTYYSLAIRENKERQSIPGAVVMSASRGAQRHRKDDILAVLLAVRGEHRYEGDEIRELAENAANIFYGAQGSVTRAMGLACEETNRRILERNVDRGYEGVQAGGSIALAALHNGWLFICQYGQTGTLLISAEKYEEFGKSEGSGETLGQSKRILPRFYQSEVRQGDLILLNSQPPSTWSSYYLAGSAVIDINLLKQRLLNQVTDDIEAVVIKVTEGVAKVVQGDWQTLAAVELEPDQQLSGLEEETALPSQERDFSALREAPIYLPPPESEILSDAIDDEPLAETTSEESLDTVSVIQGLTEQGEIQKEERPGSLHEEDPNSFVVKIARAWMKMRTLSSKIRIGADRFRKKVAPESRQLQETGTSAILLALALILPFVLVLLSVSAYTRIGRTEQYETYMQQAEEAAGLARVATDPIEQHGYWVQTLDLVMSAEKYDVSQESRMLFEQAQFLLDDMDLAVRLDFRPALTQYFPEGMMISHIQASSSGVYLLDRTSGSILRIYLNTKGFYEIDDEFSCQPGPYGLENVTDLVDLITLPANPDNYRVMAVDANGNLLYCRPGEVPVSRTLAAPEIGWGRIASVVYDNDVLYVLDAENDAIWMYAGKDPNQPNVQTASGIVFSESPVEFFDEEIPELGGALDLVINQHDVYILHQDGHMTTCRYSPTKAVRLTECQDPTPYTDNRVGREDKKPWVFLGAEFVMLQSTRLPDASIYMLDAANTSLYQFSYQLNLEHVQRPQYNRNYPLPETRPSGFGVSTDMELFLAFENKLFIAPLK